MKKIWNEQGFLSKEGEKSTQVNNFKHAVAECLETLSINDIQLMGSILHKVVGDMVFDAAQFKRDESTKLSAMSDEEFDKYLENKYKVYGDKWFLKSSLLTSEEVERQEVSTKNKIKKWADDLKKNPPKFTRSGIPPRGRGRYID